MAPMNSQKAVGLASLVFVLIAFTLSARAQEMVTIPKSRLQELERKEAELEKLKGDLSRTRNQNEHLQKQHEADVAKIISAPPPEPVVTHVSPPMASLPPLKAGEMVEAMDLANHYRADKAAADQRYRKHRFTVRGEVAGFQQLLFRHEYKLILKTADRETRVICQVLLPEKYSAVFTVNEGSELVGLVAHQTRVPIAKLGDTVTVEGRCKGLTGSAVTMSPCELKLRPD